MYLCICVQGVKMVVCESSLLFVSLSSLLRNAPGLQGRSCPQYRYTKWPPMLLYSWDCPVYLPVDWYGFLYRATAFNIFYLQRMEIITVSHFDCGDGYRWNPISLYLFDFFMEWDCNSLFSYLFFSICLFIREPAASREQLHHRVQHPWKLYVWRWEVRPRRVAVWRTARLLWQERWERLP